jgi:glycosyltransferase involved in cell wall biosynthesis
MRIALDVQWVTNQATGIGKITLNWVRELAKLDSENEYLLVGKGLQSSALAATIEGRNNFRYLNVQPVKLGWLPYAVRTVYWDQVKLPTWLKREEYDFLHLLWFNIPVVHPKPFILTIHDLDTIIHSNYYSWKFRGYYNLLLRFSLRRAVSIITVSHASKRDIIRVFRIPAERVHVVYHGVDKIFQPIEEKNCLSEIQAKYGIEGEYIIHTGGIGLRKNIGRLLEAFALVCRGTERVISLVITGVGAVDLVKQLKRYAEHLKIGERICFVGYVPEEDMPKLYCGALALVYPSVFEGFGLPIIEAMACGTPVVTSNVSSMPEIAGDSAILIDPFRVEDIAHGILEICEDSALRGMLRERGLERAQLFNWQNTVRHLLSIYSHVISDKTSKITCC